MESSTNLRVWRVEHDYRAELTTPLTERVGMLAESQWGVVAIGQLRELGASRRAIGHWLEVGRLRPLHRGVYAVGHSRLRVEGRWMAAVLACGPGTALSHQDAAALWGFRRTSSPLIHVTTTTANRHHPGIRVHRSRVLRPRDIETCEGVPTTSVARTLLDLAGAVSLADLESAVGRALQMRLVDARAVDDMLARGNGHRGRAKLARMLAGDPQITRSRMEELFLALVRGAGLPEPAMNAWLTLGAGEQFQIDALWRAQHVSVELDSWGFHGDRGSFQRDRSRAVTMTVAGFRHLQFTWRDVTERPEWVVQTLRLALGVAS